MSSLTDLMELAAEAADFAPLLVVDTLRSSNTPFDHLCADVIEGMADRITELEGTIQRQSKIPKRDGYVRLNPRKRK